MDKQGGVIKPTLPGMSRTNSNPEVTVGGGHGSMFPKEDHLDLTVGSANDFNPNEYNEYRPDYLQKKSSIACRKAKEIMDGYLVELNKRFKLEMDTEKLTLREVVTYLEKSKPSDNNSEDALPEASKKTKKEAIDFIKNKIKKRENINNFIYCAGAFIAAAIALPILAGSIALFFVPAGTVLGLVAFSLILTQTMIISLGVVGILAALIIFGSILIINHVANQTPRAITQHLKRELKEVTERSKKQNKTKRLREQMVDESRAKNKEQTKNSKKSKEKRKAGISSNNNNRDDDYAYLTVDRVEDEIAEEDLI